MFLNPSSKIRGQTKIKSFGCFTLENIKVIHNPIVSKKLKCGGVSLQSEDLHPPRGVAASPFRALCNIPDCCHP